MKSLFRMILSAVVSVGFWASSAHAQDKGTRDEAKAMVEAAIEHAKKVGAEQAFKDFTDKGNKAWQNKDLYVFSGSMEGVALAHGANDKLIGKNMLELKDAEGKPFLKEMRDTAAKGGGWVEYEWAHPQTKKTESKITYTKKMANYEAFISVGAYR